MLPEKQVKPFETAGIKRIHQDPAFLSEVMALSPDSLIVRSPDGIVDDLNPAAEIALGYPLAEAIGMNINTIIPPDQLAQEEQYIAQLTKDKKSISFESKRVRKDGKPYPVWVTAIRLPDDLNVLSNAHIITHGNPAIALIERQTEKLTSNQVFEIIQRLTLDGIIVVSENGEIRSINERFIDIWGLPLDVLKSKSIQLVLETMRSRLADQKEFDAVIVGLYGTSKKSLDKIVLKNSHTLESFTAPIENDKADGHEGRVWFFHDITEHVETGKRLGQMNAELTDAYERTIEGWSHALDLRDKETEGHSQRVADLTLRLAIAMGINEAELVHIRRGALLHDIGKMGVPDRILLKPDTLTDEEWVIMHQHPQFAYDLLKDIEYLRPALDIPYFHHEKWDGSGYPHGLKGNKIPQAARIFSIVDVWDALTSERPYRPAWPQEKVKKYIKSLSGIQFDPEVVDRFLQMV